MVRPSAPRGWKRSLIRGVSGQGCPPASGSKRKPFARSPRIRPRTTPPSAVRTSPIPGPAWGFAVEAGAARSAGPWPSQSRMEAAAASEWRMGLMEGDCTPRRTPGASERIALDELS